jgi:tetratricopeptide (TPR) repeat protein
MRKILILAGLFFLFINSYGQSASKAEKLLLAGDFLGAIDMYEKLTAAEPDKAVYHINLGECYIRTPQKNQYAIAELEKAVTLLKDNQSSEMFIDAKFLLGKAYHVNHRFREAIDVYNDLVINKAYKEFRSVDILENEIRACEAAIEAYKNQKRLSITALGEGINTDFTQHSPILVEDEGTFIYTSKEKTIFNDEKFADGEYDENIFFINLNNENDREADPFSAPLNSKDNESNCWISKDGKYMLLHKNGDIYESRKEGLLWSKPIKFDALNSKYDETHAVMTDDQSIVYFSSDRPGGKGGKDIWCIKKGKNGKWSEAKPLNANVNTKFDEESPYVHSDGTFYFSSKGHNSIGGYDIFKTTGSETKFEAPINLGVPVNSVEDDVFYFETIDHKTGYFMSKRPEGKGRGDIFSVNYTDSSMYYLLVKGHVSNSESPDFNVSMHGITKKTKVYETQTGSDGNFSTNLTRNENYYAGFESMGHFFEALTFSAPFNEEPEIDLGNIILEKITAGKVHKVYSLDFENESAEFNFENELFLQTLKRFLNQNPELVINISANPGTVEKIGKERKQNIINYLKNEGIPENRLFVDLLKYENNSDDILITILEQQGANVAFNDVVNNTNNTNNTNNLDNGDLTGIYTIQLGAFNKKLTDNDKFFKDFKGKVKYRTGPDQLNHYTYGKYKYKADAEKYLVSVHAMGFKDAFIREISWYNK